MTKDTTPKAAPKRGRGRPRSQASENSILQATLELLAKGGYTEVTVDKVAAMANASKATIYRRWPTKENLVIAAFELTTPLTIPNKQNMVESLIELIWQYSQFLQNTALGGVLPALEAERQHNPELDKYLGPLIEARRDPLRSIIKLGIENNELEKKTDVEFICDLVMGPVQLRILSMHKPVTKKYITKVVETVLASLLQK
ncbi:TetR/AcrR family transcriptional regulator [Zhongshania aquimaris]|uniref:TetR/AcrR family transcriptional regulator n=1 Tax=Zhongshania aquimaris TaxID=2857107 RepID=A0ABS6VPD7_9GAMM|nr:TetR/AcrR family transcriptional regulator [Zhongshania aquimaris]MBW2939908.1 TetR/AcrR family transcriptional regulator [Zhongshania aquimaris]